MKSTKSSAAWGFSAMLPRLAVTPLPWYSGVDQDLLVEDVDETCLPGPEADVTFAMTVGGGEEEHLLAGDEGAHLWVEIGEHLMRVKGFGSFPVAVPLLQIMFAARAGRSLLDVQRIGHHLLLCRITEECS